MKEGVSDTLDIPTIYKYEEKKDKTGDFIPTSFPFFFNLFRRLLPHDDETR